LKIADSICVPVEFVISKSVYTLSGACSSNYQRALVGLTSR
jgi:hypothetical protein